MPTLQQKSPARGSDGVPAAPPGGSERGRPVATWRRGPALRRLGIRLGVVVGLAFAVGYLPLQLFGERGLAQYRRLEREHRDLKARNARLAAEIRQMELEVRRLRDDDVTLERAARDDLGMVRPGELIFVVDE